MVNICYIYVQHISLSIHPLMDAYVVSNAALNITAQISLRSCFHFLWIYRGGQKYGERHAAYDDYNGFINSVFHVLTTKSAFAHPVCTQVGLLDNVIISFHVDLSHQLTLLESWLRFYFCVLGP